MAFGDAQFLANVFIKLRFQLKSTAALYTNVEHYL